MGVCICKRLYTIDGHQFKKDSPYPYEKIITKNGFHYLVYFACKRAADMNSGTFKSVFLSAP